MSTRTGVDRKRHGWGVADVNYLAALVLMLFGVLTLVGCTSEADLVRILSTERDAAVRQEAARDLARRQSLASTRELVAAAERDEVAAAGMDALAEECGVELEMTVQEALDTATKESAWRNGFHVSVGLEPPDGEYGVRLGELLYKTDDSDNEALGDKARVFLEETVDCLACMGTPAALDTLETFVCVDGRKVSGIREVQVRAVRAMGAQWSDEALDALIRLGGVVGDTSYFGSLRSAVTGELRKIGEPAVGPLMEVAHSEEWARDVLATMGSDAVGSLIEVLGTHKWAETALAEIGGPAMDAVSAEVSSADPNVAHRALGVLLRMFDDWEPGIEAVLLTEEMVPVLLSDLANVAFTPENAEATAEGFDHEFTACYALMEMGPPVIGAIVASDYDYRWFIVEMMGAEAVPSLMSMMTGRDREYSLGAAVTLAQMKVSSPPAVASLTEAMDQKHLEYIATHYLYYIALGEADSDWVIAEALLQYGTKQMGLDCLNCGNEVLEAAARKWGSRHGYIVYEKSGPVSAMPWGWSGASLGADEASPM